ncbi:hypothetical protein L3Q82_020405 [Scortum barcoo]|uniref:Uncharacterized protein n=1 Tax=Scortum barcoo TaxID=214431 RepID=A0ACB8V784_9TELE|nr:hypothetical protein L3Q82_020405 [Scortum barcoo]
MVLSLCEGTQLCVNKIKFGVSADLRIRLIDWLWMIEMKLTGLPAVHFGRKPGSSAEYMVDGNRNMTMASNSMTMPVSDPSAWATAMSNLGMPPISMTGQQLMPGHHSKTKEEESERQRADDWHRPHKSHDVRPGLGLAPPPLSQDVAVFKEIIHCKSCTLFPPNPNLPPPATRDRPPGCKTVFVGGLPENATEQLIVEVFGQCGDIAAIRKSKKNFCHIRFAEEFTVDKALLLSGYRVRLGSSTDKKDSGRLHVDFAQARDDLYEWECRQRMLAREERHRRKMEEDRRRPPSPPPIIHYSEHECSELGDKIKDLASPSGLLPSSPDDNKFPESVRVLVTWLERGEVNRRNANNFYSMIQSSNSHIRRLMSEKSQHEKEMEEAKDKFKTAMVAILAQFEQIVSVFHAASKQKAWDHFSKAQRKNLDMWCKQAEVSNNSKTIRNMHNEQLMGIRGEEEMEMSDDDMEDSSTANSKDSEDSGVSQTEALKEENDSLRCQLDAYRNEMELLKQEQGKNQPISSEEDNTHSQQLSFLQQALQGMQKLEKKQLLRMRDELKEREAELEKSIEDKQQLESQIHNLKAGLRNLQTTHTARQDVTASSTVSCSQEKEGPPEKNRPSPVHSERDALLVALNTIKHYQEVFKITGKTTDIKKSSPQCLQLQSQQKWIISTFLHVHPFGASMEYICSYLQRLDTKINPGEVEALLSRLPFTFRQELTGVGASLEKRWNFCGFQGIKST